MYEYAALLAQEGEAVKLLEIVNSALRMYCISASNWPLVSRKKHIKFLPNTYWRKLMRPLTEENISRFAG